MMQNIFVIPETYPDMLIHVAGGREHSVTDVAFVWSVTFSIRSGSSSIHHDSMDRLEMNIQIPGLRIASTTQTALKWTLVCVRPHMSLKQ